MANFLDEIRVFEGDKEAEILLRCRRLVKEFLKEEERFLEHLETENKDTKFSKFRIARIKYTLGETDKHPNFREYFNERTY